ncbi:MAG: glycosyl hydrolase [Pirellulaceae bacterium]
MGLLSGLLVVVAALGGDPALPSDIEQSFAVPSDAARPWVYLMISDGNLSREGMTADLESMKAAGIGGLIIMEVDVGIARGPVAFMSDRWCELFRHAVEESERLGLQITLNAGPGWTGSGGPWVKAEQSMQYLVASEVHVTGPSRFESLVPRPAAREPYFGAQGLPEEMLRSRENFYEDVAVLAVRRTQSDLRIKDIDEKALYKRDPYTSMPGVKPYLAPPAPGDESSVADVLRSEDVIELALTDHLQSDGRLVWDVPPGNWTILRFGRRTTGANTRPAPQPGLGWESDKFDKAALEAHFEAFVGKLLRTIGPRPLSRTTGWTMLHIDSWEMGAQNWSAQFPAEFQRRRGYNPVGKYLPVMTGRIVESLELSERFLWDLRRTAQELVVEQHAIHLRELGRRHGFGLSIEPYDMNPAGDMTLGAVADVPMCEFWSEGFVLQSLFSCIEAASVAHTSGRRIVAAEAFTADATEAWRFFPATLKNQGDWAFGTGVNRLVFHRYAHQPWLDRQPGMTMGPYGVHWERTQTWWPMVLGYHQYLARCQTMLRLGTPVADILYLAPEGAPHVFRAPASALVGPLGDRRGYNFDGCPPETLLASASVVDGRIAFPGGTSYRLLILPAFDTMTPALLGKIESLVSAGATIVGTPPARSPSLSGYPQCDEEVRQIVHKIWGDQRAPTERANRKFGHGEVHFGGDLHCELREGPGLHPISRADWIWYPEGNPAVSAPPQQRYFRHTFSLDASRPVAGAHVEMTADNAFQLWVNGELALQGDNFHAVARAEITSYLRGGENRLCVLATNGSDHDNPAGLLGAVTVRFEDGGQLTVYTDDRWLAANAAEKEDWYARDSDEAQWQPAKKLGPAPMAPWSLDPAAGDVPPLYPEYEATARLLRAAGVEPDFESNGPIRYTHRRLADAEIYFVSNRTDERVSTDCSFRVDRGEPELWDPVTGTVRALAVYHQADGRTQIPLQFAPCQSYFVVFRKSTIAHAGNIPDTVNFPVSEPIGVLEGPWDVSFETTKGGPASLVMETLADWSQHPDPSVRHYSGIATYRRTFDLPDVPRESASHILLDLGTVHSIARVRLNGQDLGVVWCAPWHVDLTAALQDRDNQLEIEVANLWPNRLIGDAALPPSERLSWTTWNPYQPTDALLPSGLLGPIVLRRE